MFPNGSLAPWTMAKVFWLLQQASSKLRGQGNLRGNIMRSASFRAALAAALVFVFAPREAAFGWGPVRVVAFGDSLMDAGTYAPFAGKAPFNGGRYTTNPGPNFAQDIAKYCTNPALFASSLYCSPRTYNTTKLTSDPANDFIFADEIHPSARTSTLFAAYAEQQIAAMGW